VKSGFVGIAGRPNVGKSTLVNALAGGKVAIVSDKPQTTRRRIRGIVNGEGSQLVLVDLPGFQRPLDPLTEHMQRTVDESLADVDAAVLVLDGRQRIGGGDRFVAERLFGLGMPVVIVLNKVDRMKPEQIVAQIDAASKLGDFHELYPVSARTGLGVEELREELLELLPEGPAYFPTDQVSDLSLEVQVAEIVREKALALTREEVPHAISVEVDELTEKVVRAIVYVETESQKGIVVGKGGRIVREIGTRARPELEALLGRRIFLELQVKVKEKWRSDERMLEQLGL
jgi:GTP-binding protein Era